MVMSYIWAIFVILAFLFGIFGGRINAVSEAALQGAQAAVTLSVSLAGAMCLWNGVIEVLRQTGADRTLARLMRPILGRLLPSHRYDDEIMGAAASNVTANLLGLGNAATPLGVRAATLMSKQAAKPGALTQKRPDASRDLICFLVLNTSSVQLVPATIAALRGGLGAASPFDILPAVWLASAVSLAVGLTLCKIFGRVTSK